jgi:putative FmdB family regulatory protein
MPIYEYKCQKCGTFEINQRITENALGKCPTCRGKVKKLISNTSFQLKGTGWYVTDYARKGNNGDAKSEDAAKPSADTKTDTKKVDSSSTKSDKSSALSSTPATDT